MTNFDPYPCTELQPRPTFDFGDMTATEIVGTVAFARAFAHNPGEHGGPELDTESLSVMQEVVRSHGGEVAEINDPKKIAGQLYDILTAATDKLAETNLGLFTEVAFASATSEDPEDRIEIALSDGICQLTVSHPVTGMKLWSLLLGNSDQAVRAASYQRLSDMDKKGPEHLKEAYGLTVEQHAKLVETHRLAERAVQEEARMLSYEARLGRTALQRLTTNQKQTLPATD